MGWRRMQQQDSALLTDVQFGTSVYPSISHRDLPIAELLEVAIRRREGTMSANGAFNAITAPRTGRSPKDKFIVRSGEAERLVWWDYNAPYDSDRFDLLFSKVADYVMQRDAFVFNGYAGADPEYRIAVRVTTELAWHNMFVRQLFIRPTAEELRTHKPDFQVVCMPGFHADPRRDGTNSEAFILVNFTKRIVLICGTRYAGEMKKSIFTVMNYLMPQRGVFPMHCSANVGKDSDVAIFFGLSGTGKTTLSADPERRLVGDDEHGWSDRGVFNFEGGCYAKCINLSREKEPQIYDAIRFGSVLENVILNEDRKPDYDDNAITENTRCAYPVDFIDNAVIPGVAGHPSNVIFLTADATGVLPPVSRLTEPQAMYHFMSGYTSKLAGTETGVTKPEAVFSTCFGAPFLPLPPTVYAEMLGKKLTDHKAQCWLVNTGWNGGPYGVGHRISIAHTRQIIHAILNGTLKEAKFNPEPMFGVLVPEEVPGLPPEILQPRNTWSDKDAYDAARRALAGQFAKNFEKFSNVAKEITEAGPKLED